MVRATATEVVKLFGGSYPPGLDATKVGNLCADGDYVLDGYVKVTYKTDLSTTDTDVVSIANHIVFRLCMRALWAQGGGALTGMQEPVILTEELKIRIAAVLGSTTTDGYGYMKMQAEA